MPAELRSWLDPATIVVATGPGFQSPPRFEEREDAIYSTQERTRAVFGDGNANRVRPRKRGHPTYVSMLGFTRRAVAVRRSVVAWKRKEELNRALEEIRSRCE
ncbi:hypothetical protein JCM18750_11520 [Halostagnicola bangensis]